MNIIILETPNFVFHAAGNNAIEAIAALRSGIIEHCRESGADKAWMLQAADEANMIELNAGECLRDYDTKLATKETA